MIMLEKFQTILKIHRIYKIQVYVWQRSQKHFNNQFNNINESEWTVTRQVYHDYIGETSNESENTQKLQNSSIRLAEITKVFQ